jgi:hypothetical protein
VDLLKDGGAAALAAAAADMTARLAPECTRVLWVVEGAHKYVHALQKRAVSVAPATLVDAEVALLVDHGVEVRHARDSEDAAQYLRNVTRAVAERPHRIAPTALACVRKIVVRGSVAAALSGGAGTGAGAGASDSDAGSRRSDDGGAAGAGEDDAGDGVAAVGGRPRRSLRDVWWAMLQMIPGVSAGRCVGLRSFACVPRAHVVARSLARSRAFPGLRTWCAGSRP